jgi:nucleoside-diphosphate-sugar epimerase
MTEVYPAPLNRDVPATRDRYVVCLGLGYSARALVSRIRGRATEIVGTTRSEEKADDLCRSGIRGLVADDSAYSPVLGDAIRSATHIVVSAAPGAGGDPFLAHYERDVAHAERLEWIGYLSTIGVYGDHDGAWIDERAACRPTNDRGEWRLEAEARWSALGHRMQVPVGIFRLAGIYGPGRNQLRALADGKARRVVKPGQVFNRIHVEDIAHTLEAAIERPAARVYNVTDDEPAPPQDVVMYAAELMGVEPPPAIAFEEAEMSPMARSFWGDVKRVSNRRIREELGVSLDYPTYREGLAELWRSGRWRG